VAHQRDLQGPGAERGRVRQEGKAPATSRDLENHRGRQAPVSKVKKTRRTPRQDTTALILKATNNPELLEIYAAILNPQRKDQANEDTGPTNYILQHNVDRPQRTPMLSTTAMRKRKQISDTQGATEQDRLSQATKKAATEPRETISVDGISGSAEALVVAINELYNRCATVAGTFGVQTKDITAKLDAMSHGQQ
jgi:hypothetical protein